MYKKNIKAVLDWILAFVLLIILSPFIMIIIILLLAGLEGPVFFIHERPGLHNKPFKMIKFRTMNNKRGPDGELLPNKQRITKIGAFLRKFSLDEIPQVFNVINGDLSLVGPRPLEMRYLSYYTIEQIHRHDVKPGITGWAQVNGRNSISWEEKFKLDIWYVDNLSFKLDMKILYLTFIKVIKHEAVNSDDQNTVVPFDEYLKTGKTKV